MRQDLSTYEANVAKKLDIVARTEMISGVIDLRLKRLEEAENFNGQLLDFLNDGIS